MNTPLEGHSLEMQEAITEISALRNITPEAAVCKAGATQHIWRLATLEDGIVLLLDLSRLDHDLNGATH